MNEEINNETPEVPDFEGEEMKMPENASAPAELEEKSMATGPIILILVILLIVILAGMYYWFSILSNQPEPTQMNTTIERPTPEENNEPESTTAEAQTDNLETVSTSDEINAIDADVEATNLESLDAELEAIDAELEAS